VNKARNLLTYHDLTVEVESSPGEELIDHMKETVLGTPGGLRYQFTDIADRLSSLGENYFLFLRKQGKMLGSAGFCGRPASVAGSTHDSWLIRYVSIKAPMRTVPIKREGPEEEKRLLKRTSVLGRLIQPVSANPALVRDPDLKEVTPALIYGFIEQKNLRSSNFSLQLGLEKVGEMVTFTFSRMQPGNSKKIEQLAEAAQGEMLSLITDFYKDYTLFTAAPLFRDNHYFVIREQGRVVAGLQVHDVTWRICDFGSGMVNRIIRLLTRIPYFRRRLNPDALKLVAFDGIYCETGHEALLYELMEGVLARKKRYIALLMMDLQSTLYKIYLDRQELGILHRLLGNFNAEIKMHFVNLPGEVRQYYYDHPTYITPFDNT